MQVSQLVENKRLTQTCPELCRLSVTESGSLTLELTLITLEPECLTTGLPQKDSLRKMHELHLELLWMGIWHHREDG